MDWAKLIFSTDISFAEKSKKIFEYQYQQNAVYHTFCDALSYTPKHLEQSGLKEIPLLPVKAFKEAKIVTGEEHSKFNIQNSATCLPTGGLQFTSSGTSGMKPGIHRVKDRSIYDQSLLKGFKLFYDLEHIVIWGYTPEYDDNPASSLIYMIQKLIEQDESGFSRFLPLNSALKEAEIDEVKKSGRQLIIFGAAFGLIDLVEKSSVQLPSNSIVIETGGMKTHRREIRRKELRRTLAEGFGLDSTRIHSEYGMAELLSQAYATGSNWFRTVPWMKVSIRNPDNSFEEMPPCREGVIGVIDLANVHSCSFLLTGDRGMKDKKGRFQVLGRWNPKDLRGCNFLLEED